MSKISEIRRIIRNFNGAKFNTTDIRKGVGMYVQTGQRLEDLVRMGELEKLDMIKTGGRSTREWREIKINIALMSAEDVKPAKFAKQKDPWEEVYPEYFRDPMLPGNVRQFIAPL